MSATSRILLSLLYLSLHAAAAGAADTKPTWQVDWDKAVKSAESEGEVSVYVVDYPRFTVEHFRKTYPKIKLNVVDGRAAPSFPRA